MRHRHDANLDEAMTWKRARPISRTRAVVYAVLVCLLLGGYGYYGYREKQEREAAARSGKPGSAVPPTSAPAGR